MKKIIFIFFFHLLLLLSLQAMQDQKDNSVSQCCFYKEKKLKPKKNFSATNANSRVMPNNNHNLPGTGLGGSIALFYYYMLRKTDN